MTEATSLVDALTPEMSRRDSMALLIRAFEAAGIADAASDARLLLCAAADIDHADLIRDPEAPLDEFARELLAAYGQRRFAREPVTRILGTRGFWSLDIEVAPDVLDPRPDSETIVDAALKILGERQNDPLRIADLGVGSGAILCALLDIFQNASGLGVDVSPTACALATRNLRTCGMMTRGRVENGMWESLEGGHFDLVVSNPPYIASNDIPGLDPEVRNFDPGLALDGGADGLDAYRSLGATLPRVLAPGGIAIVELGQGQAAAVGLIFREAGLLILGVQNDLAGVERVLIARKMPNSEGKSPPATLSSVSPLGAGQKSD